MHETHMSIVGPRGASLGWSQGAAVVGATEGGFIAIHVRDGSGALGSLYLDPHEAEVLQRDITRWLPTAYGNQRRQKEASR